MLKQKLEDQIMDKFFANRDELINRYSAGEMSKTEFVEENYKFIMDLKLNPFEGKLKDYKQCIYNYQYYNIFAKYCNLKAQDYEFFEPEKSKFYKEEEFKYYANKDQATLCMLECVEYKNVDAYLLKLNSKRLSGNLFEVVFKDYDKAIFHSMNNSILYELRQHRVFSYTPKDSVISMYVNSLY